MMDVELRVKQWLNDEEPESHTLLLAHAGVVRILRCILGEKRDQAFSYAVPHLGWQTHTWT